MAPTKSNAGKTKPESQAAEDLMELFEDELKDIYWAEKALTKALPKMAKNSSSPELVKAINEHLKVTQKQAERVEQVFKTLGKEAKAKKCEAMDGLIKEGEEIVKATEIGAVRDAGIISACQKVEHYEIASYGTLASFAKILGKDKAAALLQQTLAEEKDADVTLTGIAESVINLDAVEGDSDVKTATKKQAKKQRKPDC